MKLSLMKDICLSGMIRFDSYAAACTHKDFGYKDFTAMQQNLTELIRVINNKSNRNFFISTLHKTPICTNQKGKGLDYFLSNFSQ